MAKKIKNSAVPRNLFSTNSFLPGIFILLFCINIVYGFLKQTKTIWRSADAYSAVSEDIGQDARALRNEWFMHDTTLFEKKPFVRWVDNCSEKNEEKREAAQYGLAPLLLTMQDTSLLYEVRSCPQ